VLDSKRHPKDDVYLARNDQTGEFRVESEASNVAQIGDKRE